MTKFRKGDVVAVEFIVDSAFGDDDLKLRLHDSYSDVYVKDRDATMVRPLIEVDDSVLWTSFNVEYDGQVKAISDKHAWILMPSGDYATVCLHLLRRGVVPAVAGGPAAEGPRMVPRFDEYPPQSLGAGVA